MTIKPGVPHTNSVLCAGLWFVRLPLYKHLLLSLSSLIDWFISALMLEIESTLRLQQRCKDLPSALTVSSLRPCVWVCVFVTLSPWMCKGSLTSTRRWMHKKGQSTLLSFSFSLCFLPHLDTRNPILSTPLFQCSVSPPSLILLGEHGSMQWKKLSQ